MNTRGTDAGNVSKKVITVTLPAGTTSVTLTNCEAQFEFNSYLLNIVGSS